MAITRKIVAAALAVMALAASAASALAAPAYATSPLNVRSGPGTQYRVIDTLQRGEWVDVQHCQGSWCFIHQSGPNGWVSANYLQRSGAQPRPPVVQPPIVQPPIVRPPPPVVRPPYYPPPGWNRPGYPPPGWYPRPPRPPYPQPPQRPGASFCYNGPNGYFCFGS